MVKDKKLVEELIRDCTGAPIRPAERALLNYAVKLAREPWAMAAEDISKLRAAGWSDAAILDLNWTREGGRRMVFAQRQS